MRLVTFERHDPLGPDRVRVGAQIENDRGSFVLDLAQADPRLSSEMSLLLGAGAPALGLARAAVAAAGPDALLPAAGVSVLAPVPHPGKILCVGYNYVGHDAAGAVERPEFPEIFAKTANTVVGPEQAIVLPRASRQVDYEAELAGVIGTGGRDIAPSDAMEHVAGYTLFNDVSARDWQGRGSQWLLGKSFDTFGPLGPALVTADEVPDPQCLDIELTVNGQTMQRASTRDMIFSVRYLVAYLSQVMTLEPGDIISTGTPAKLPEAAANQRFLAPGDVVRLTIGGVGTLSNPVASSAPAQARSAR